MRRKVICLVFLFLFCSKAQASESDLIISEIMYDVAGADSGHEWIELYNSGIEELIASSTWRFFDGSNHSINFYQGTTTIASNEFFVLADNGEQFLLDYPDFSGNLYDTVMSLPNSSSSIALSFDKGLNYPSEAIYDSAWGGGNGFSLEKLNEFWQASCLEGGSPGLNNIECEIEEPPEEEDPLPEEINNWSQLLINEFLPNPVGSDDNEWIELYNQGPEVLNLEGLKIKDNSTRIFTLDIDDNLNLNLLPNNYLLIPKSISQISLNNSNGDGVIIMDPNEHIIDSVIYNDTALEARSYAKFDNVFVWTKTPTPGTANQISLNQIPVAQISVTNSLFLLGEKLDFSASNSYDPDSEDLDYLWEFGDSKTSTKENIKHSFDKLGSYTVRLTVTDSEGAYDTIEFPINIYQGEEVEKKDIILGEEEIIAIDLAEDDLIISEFIPNPEGSDDNEWIELYNTTDRDINLYAWQLDDQDGGSKPHQFSTSTIVLAKSFLLLDREQTKITLNNSSDSVRLLDYEDNVYQEVIYEKIPEGKSYAWDFANNEWAINDPSPGKENIFAQDIMQDQDGEVKILEIVYGVAEINDLEKNDEIIVQGVVINNISEADRSLYLADYNFSSMNFEEIVEIYSYYKDWPDIKAGELVTVRGKISKLDDLPRIKIKTAQDIWKNDLEINLSDAEIIAVEDINQDLLGAYINTKGIVVKKSGKNIYLASDIEEEYILRVYSKFFTKELAIKKGDEMIVSGILSETDSSFKLVPFDIGAMAVSKTVLGEKIESKNYEETTISTSTSQVVAENRKNSIKNILVFIIIGLILVSLIYFIKKKRG
jgi:PKD repeat protein